MRGFTIPALSLSLGDSTSYFSWGGGGSIVGEFRLPFFPLAMAQAEIGYPFAPLFGVKAHEEGGANYGFINSDPTVVVS